MSSRKERLLHIITQLNTYAPQMPQEIKSKLEQAEEILQQSSEEKIDQLTDNVFSEPPTAREFDASNPEYLLQSSYAQLERLSRDKNADPQLEKVMETMRHYFSIDEKDGFFP